MSGRDPIPLVHEVTRSNCKQSPNKGGVSKARDFQSDAPSRGTGELIE